MFRKILIANRGEIALRIIRACRELGVGTVVAYSEADAESLPVALADEAVCIGPAPALRSYLNVPNVVSAALITDCEAIHPGYGFLAENPYFAEICERYGLVFIGPEPSLIAAMADKSQARRVMAAHGLPILPGSYNSVKSADEALRLAAELGYPAVLKATFGGGGRGMRVLKSDDDVVAAFPVLAAEAEKAFKRPDLYMERYLDGARHIEFQVLGDCYGTVRHLGERDCSLQRRSQKLIEEAPAPGIDAATRDAMGAAVIRALEALRYRGAGTVEFLVDAAGDFFFMEMNTRVQVEHPVTEMVTGIDIVKWQLRLAAGEPLTLEAPSLVGCAIEARVNAENAAQGLRPETGTIHRYRPPGGPGVRVESHLYAGYRVEPYYDSLLAKVIAWGNSRDEAIGRLRGALSELVIEGVTTTVPLLQQLLAAPAFLQGRATVTTAEALLEEWVRTPAVVGAR